MGSVSLPAHAAETSFHAAGYGNVGLNVPLDGEPAWFPAAAFNPIFLWREGDRILIENELEFTDEEDGLEVGLEYASVDIDIGGPVLIVGKFLTPTGQFVSRLHPSWINKFVDFPLPYRIGVTPMSHLGASLQHAVNFGTQQKVSAVLFTDQGAGTATGGGPSLMASPSNPDGGFGVGGRLGLFPLAGLELGASGYTSSYGTDGAERYTLLIGDVSWTHPERGLDMRGEFLQAQWAEDAVFQGAWAQVAMRLVAIDAVRWLEPAARFGYASGDTLQGDVMAVSAGHADGNVDLGDGPVYELCFSGNAYLRSNVVAKLSYVHRVEVYEPTLRAQIAFGY